MLEREYSYSFIKTDHFVGFCELLILWACELCADISSGLLEEVEQVRGGGLGINFGSGWKLEPIRRVNLGVV